MLSGPALFSQDANQILPGYYIDYWVKPVSISRTSLFDSREISSRGISACYVVRQQNDDNNEKTLQDTVRVFFFDQNGNLQKEIRLSYFDGTKDTLYRYFTDRTYIRQIDSVVVKENGQTRITEYMQWAFNYETPVMDTGIIRNKYYDDKGRVIEYKMNGSRDYLELTHCGTGITYHEKYRYDSKNRLVQYNDVGGREFATYTYYPRHRVIRVHDYKTGKRMYKFRIEAYETGLEIHEKMGESNLVLSRLNKKSKLFSHFLFTENEKREVYHFIYAYFDQAAPAVSASFYTTSR